MIEQVLTEIVRAAVAPLAEELRQLRVTVEQLRHALPPILVTTREAAERLGVSESTIRRQIRTGAIPVRRVGRALRIDLTDMRVKSHEAIAQLADAARASPRGSR